MNRSKLFNAPIPGENLTTNAKNWAWHKPPKYSNFDDAFEYFLEDVIAEPSRINAARTMARNGFTALSLVQNLMIQEVAKGHITPDMTLLIAGPVYKTLTRMFDTLGETYLTGYESPEELKAYVERMQSDKPKKSKKTKLTKAQEKEMQKITEDASSEIPEGGLMGASRKTDVEIPMDKPTGSLVEQPVEELN